MCAAGIKAEQDCRLDIFQMTVFLVFLLLHERAFHGVDGRHFWLGVWEWVIDEAREHLDRLVGLGLVYGRGAMLGGELFIPVIYIVRRN